MLCQGQQPVKKRHLAHDPTYMKLYLTQNQKQEIEWLLSGPGVRESGGLLFDVQFQLCKMKRMLVIDCTAM